MATEPSKSGSLGEEPKSPLKLLLVVFPLLILSVIEHGIALPVLPGAGKFFDATPIEIGFLFSIQYLGQFIMSPVWGTLSDKFGRKSMFILALVTGGIAELLTAWSPSLTVLMIGRLFVGLTAGNIAIGSALMSDMTTLRDRSKGMALIGISFGLGFVIGPPIGGIAASIGGHETTGMFALGLPFFFAAVALFLSGILAIWLIPSPSRYAEVTAWNHKVADEGAAEIAAAKHLTDKQIQRQNLYPLVAATMMCLLYLGYTICTGSIETRLSPYLSEIYHLDPKMIGYTFAGVGLVMLFVQGSISKLSKYISDFQLVAFGGLIAGIGYIISSFSHSYGFFFTLICIASVGRGLFFPGLLSLTSKCYDSPRTTGRVMGFLNSSGSLGRIIGPLLGGQLVESFSPSTPFLTGGAFITTLLVIWIIGWLINGSKRRQLAQATANG